MKGVIVRSISRGILAAAVLSLAGFGCQNRVVDENLALRNQNLELQQQLDDAHRQPVVVQAPPAPLPAAPAVQASAVNPRPVEEVAQPTAPEPTSAPRPDLGGLEVTRDAVANTTTINLPSDVFFASGQAVLLPEAKKSLTKVIVALKKEYGGKQIRIQGNTDSDPIRKSHWKDNKELSEKRAEAVRDYLVSKGVDTGRVNTQGLGDTHPRSKTDKAKNRRVDLVVLGVK